MLFVWRKESRFIEDACLVLLQSLQLYSFFAVYLAFALRII